MKGKISRVVSLGLVVIGLVLLVNAGWPILSYELFAATHLTLREELVSPISTGSNRGTTEAYPLNLTKARNWFVGSPGLDDTPSKVNYYNLSIPGLKIDGASVEIGGDDLAESLIHYQGTALPGRPGNTVIFGHSTLPQLFDPENYLSIFSTLPTVEKGNIVKLEYDGITYSFRIEEMFEVRPTDVQVLEQRYDDSYLTLITCVPPGTYLKRLVVRGRLVPPSQI